MGVNVSFRPFESLLQVWKMAHWRNFPKPKMARWQGRRIPIQVWNMFLSPGQRWVPMLPNPNNQRQVVEETAQFLASVAILNKGHKSDLLIAENDKGVQNLWEKWWFSCSRSIPSEHLHCDSWHLHIQWFLLCPLFLLIIIIKDHKSWWHFDRHKDRVFHC